MDKLSLYEFLSFFLPGITATYIVYQLISADYYFLKPSTDLFDGLMVSILSLIAGLVIHRITFWFLRYKWYAWLVYPSIASIVEKNFEKTKDDYEMLIAVLGHENDTPVNCLIKPISFLNATIKLLRQKCSRVCISF